MDIARTVRFLALEADYITGQIIPVDGGRTVQQ
jgi:pteridine reductase